MNKGLREWTILLYMAGNNDLAPEFATAFHLAQSVPSDCEVAVVSQISLETPELIQILRPFDTFSNVEAWPLPGRYCLEQGTSTLLEPMERCAMSNPEALFEFVLWGARSFPAKHYLLVLGGHGYQFVGCMPDYSGKRPSIMGYVAMSEVLQQACTCANIRIDILLLDTCYFNFIETLSEFGKYEDCKVSYLLTNIMNGPLAGYSLPSLIRTVQEQKYEANTLLLLERLLTKAECDMCVYEVNHTALTRIKELFHTLALEYSQSSLYDTIPLPQLFLKKDSNLPFGAILKEIEQLSLPLVVLQSSRRNQNQSVLNIANMPTTLLSVGKQYQNLHFAKNNQWTNLLLASLDDSSSKETQMSPISLTPQAVYAFVSIMNQGCSESERKKIFYELLQERGWLLKT